jgi:cytochrome P450
MLTSARDVAERWTRQEGERDILSEMAGLTADIICRSLFGHALGAEFAREIVEGFSDYQASIGRLDLVSLLGLPEWTPRWRSPAARRATRRIHAALDRIIARHRASADGGGLSMIDGLMRARDERGAAMSDEGLRNEIAVLFMAGHETTANTMTWVWYLLSQAPDVEARLHAELAEVLGGREPGFADVGALPYARAVIEETMRLYPPVPILPREATRDETYNGVKIPRGSLLFVVPWLLHRHKKLWREPDCFMPERFLPGGDEPVSKYAYVPFSVGPRVCAGLSFGMTEMILCLASLAQRFRLRPRAGYVARPVCRLTLRPEGGMPMIVTPRAPVAGSSAASVPRAPGCPAHHA